MSDKKAVIKNADMSEEMQQVKTLIIQSRTSLWFCFKQRSIIPKFCHQQDAVDCATEALEKYNVEKDIAAFIKKEMDKK